jgi:hypothetical protein
VWGGASLTVSCRYLFQRLAGAHLDREGLEAHQTKVLYQLADGHVQRSITWRGGRQRIFEVGEVLHLGIKLQVEVCF